MKTMKNLSNIVRYFLFLLVLWSLALTPFAASALDEKSLNISSPNAMVCEALSRIGMGCGTSQTTLQANTPTPSPTLVGNTNISSNLTAAIYNSGSNSKRGDIVLVRAIGRPEVYEITGGKRHFIPTKDIFYDYGFRDELIQNITVEALNRYPRAKLIKVEGDNKKTYYLTEGQMLRLIPGKKVLDSYGDRNEDIVVISKKEFNFYPQNQFIFLEKPLRRDIFQIVDGKKRYMTPMAVERMMLRDIDVAPVNEVELNYYMMGPPIVL